MELGEQLQKLRVQKNMSREELAQEMNVSRQAVYKWENNKGIS
ncbi:MAG: helix-turn-helix transcriptional regulator [Bacillota bacterium]